MNSLKETFSLIRKKDGVAWELIEQDYLLSWVLAGIADVAELRSKVVFKGEPPLKSLILVSIGIHKILIFRQLIICQVMINWKDLSNRLVLPQ